MWIKFSNTTGSPDSAPANITRIKHKTRYFPGNRTSIAEEGYNRDSCKSAPPSRGENKQEQRRKLRRAETIEVGCQALQSDKYPPLERLRPCPVHGPEGGNTGRSRHRRNLHPLYNIRLKKFSKVFSNVILEYFRRWHFY